MPHTPVIEHPSDAHLVAYMDDELPAEQGDDVRRHLSTCLTCHRTVEELATLSMQVARDAQALDDTEPARWRTPASPSSPVDAIRVRHASERSVRHSSPRMPRHVVRWAATVLLVAGGVASAAIVGPRIRSVLTGEKSPDDAPRILPAPPPVTPTPVGSIALSPAAGEFTVEIAEAGAGSRVVVELSDRSDVGVELRSDSSQVATPRFRTGDGRVLVQLAQRVVIVNVQFPRGIRSGRVVAGGTVIARVADARVDPANAATTGIAIATRP
jgi:hypothetical protein